LNQQKPPCGPESEQAPEQKALATVEALHQLTCTILAQGSTPEFPQISQWILQRGELMDEVARLPLLSLSEGIRQQILEKLQACQEMDVTVTKNLAVCHEQLASQLRGAKDSRTLMNKYRIPDSDPDAQGTRSRNA
jgi:hypothetical protein